MDESNVIRNEFADAITIQDMGLKPGRNALNVDYARYKPFFVDSGLTEEQQHAIIDAISLLMMGFVHLGFEIHPVQQACGQLGKEHAQRPKPSSNAVGSNGKPLRIAFNQVASAADSEAVER